MHSRVEEPHERQERIEARRRAEWERERAEHGCGRCVHGAQCPGCGLVWCGLHGSWADDGDAAGCDEWRWS